MPKITNELYLEFKQHGVINIVDEALITRVLNNITGRFKAMSRAFVIALYYTGARPVEVLNLKGSNFKKEGSYLIVQVPPSKRGLARPIYLGMSKPLVEELYKYVISAYPDTYLFYQYRSNYTRIINGKPYVILSDRLRYYFKKWFGDILDISPYYLRHNRFSSLMLKGASIQDIRQLKGSKTDASVTPYLHLSTKGAKKISRLLE